MSDADHGTVAALASPEPSAADLSLLGDVVQVAVGPAGCCAGPGQPRQRCRRSERPSRHELQIRRTTVTAIPTMHGMGRAIGYESIRTGSARMCVVLREVAGRHDVT